MATKKPTKAMRTTTPKVFDVAKPGKAAAPATSKPVIVTNRPILKDPMVVEDKTDAADAPVVGEVPAATSTTSTKLTIKPLHVVDTTAMPKPKKVVKSPTAEAIPDVLEAVKPGPPEVTVTPDEPASEPSPKAVVPKKAAQKLVITDTSDETASGPVESTASSEATTKESPDNTVPVTIKPSTATKATTGVQKSSTRPASSLAAEDTETSATMTSTADDPTTDDTAESADDSDTAKKVTDPKADEEAARKETERETKLNELADSRKYYLPINQVEKRRNKRAALLGVLLVIILCAAWADVALDAGIIKISGVKPVTHFFNK